MGHLNIQATPVSPKPPLANATLQHIWTNCYVTNTWSCPSFSPFVWLCLHVYQRGSL